MKSNSVESFAYQLLVKIVIRCSEIQFVSVARVEFEVCSILGPVRFMHTVNLLFLLPYLVICMLRNVNCRLSDFTISDWEWLVGYSASTTSKPGTSCRRHLQIKWQTISQTQFNKFTQIELTSIKLSLERSNKSKIETFRETRKTTSHCLF